MAETTTNKPILFSTTMVQAILAGKKTQTRRLVRGEALDIMKPMARGAEPLKQREVIVFKPAGDITTPGAEPSYQRIVFPFGETGGHLWVKETYAIVGRTTQYAIYKADDVVYDGKWKPSLFMPRSLSRIDLTIKGWRVERLQDIRGEDVRKEGLPLRSAFYAKWNELHTSDGSRWQDDPWVWVIDFERNRGEAAATHTFRPSRAAAAKPRPTARGRAM